MLLAIISIITQNSLRSGLVVAAVMLYILTIVTWSTRSASKTSKVQYRAVEQESDKTTIFIDLRHNAQEFRHYTDALGMQGPLYGHLGYSAIRQNEATITSAVLNQAKRRRPGSVLSSFSLLCIRREHCIHCTAVDNFVHC